jgi:hypothetical protein
MKEQNDKSKFKDRFKKRLYEFTLKLIEFLDKLPKDNVSKRIGDQLLRSGTSILGNYIEGQSALALLRDSGRAKRDEVTWFLNELEEISNVFGSSILTLKGKR